MTEEENAELIALKMIHQYYHCCHSEGISYTVAAKELATSVIVTLILGLSSTNKAFTSAQFFSDLKTKVETALFEYEQSPSTEVH